MVGPIEAFVRVATSWTVVKAWIMTRWNQNKDVESGNDVDVVQIFFDESLMDLILTGILIWRICRVVVVEGEVVVRRRMNESASEGYSEWSCFLVQCTVTGIIMSIHPTNIIVWDSLLFGVHWNLFTNVSQQYN